MELEHKMKLSNVILIQCWALLYFTDYNKVEGGIACSYQIQQSCENVTVTTNASIGRIINTVYYTETSGEERERRSNSIFDMVMSNSTYFDLQYVDSEWRLTVKNCMRAGFDGRLEISIGADKDPYKSCYPTRVHISMTPTIPNFLTGSFEDSTVVCTDNGRKQILALGEKENAADTDGRRRRTLTDVCTHTLANDYSCNSAHISIISVRSISSCVSFVCSASCTNSEKLFWVLNGTDILTQAADVDFNFTYQLCVTCTDNKHEYTSHKTISVQAFEVLFLTETVCSQIDVKESFMSVNSSNEYLIWKNTTVIRKYVTQTDTDQITPSLTDTSGLKNSMTTLPKTNNANASTKEDIHVLSTNSNKTAGKGKQNTTTYIPRMRTTTDAVSIKSNRNIPLSSQEVSTIKAISTEINTSAVAANMTSLSTTSKLLGMTTYTNTNLTSLSSVGTAVQSITSQVTKQQAHPLLTSWLNVISYSTKREIPSTDTTQDSFDLLIMTQVSTEQSIILPSASNIQPTLSKAVETVSHSISPLHARTGKGRASGHAGSATLSKLTSRHTITSSQNKGDVATLFGTVINDNTNLTGTILLQSTQNDELSTQVYTNDSNFAPAIGDFESNVNIPAITTAVVAMTGALVLVGCYWFMRKQCFTPVRAAMISNEEDQSSEAVDLNGSS